MTRRQRKTPKITGANSLRQAVGRLFGVTTLWFQARARCQRLALMADLHVFDCMMLWLTLCHI